jgi:hypothetical protein
MFLELFICYNKKKTPMQIIDNFLPESVFLSVQEMFLREDFPWFWNNSKSFVEEGNADNFLCDILNNHQFIHTFYNDNSRLSNWNIEPILKLLNVRAIVRVKANLNVRTNNIVTYGFHIDNTFDCKTAIFYVNSNNGKTIFQNGEEVESIENRMVIFDSGLYHTGTSCTDQKRRIVLNINYF